MSEQVRLFVGPTAHGVDVPVSAGVALLPPVRRGDVQRIVDDEQPGVLAVADGTFHSYPSVAHAELRHALEAGWQVWGLCSMGAIRAAEMRHLGMRGYGRVYEMYATDPEFDDDEVALLHAGEAPHRPLSEPLVHIRFFLDGLVGRNLLDAEGRAAVVTELKHRWYAERTLPGLAAALTKAGLDEDLVAAELADFSPYRLKALDLVEFVKEQPWCTPSPR